MWKDWMPNCEFNKNLLVVRHSSWYDRALSKTTTMKLLDNLEGLQAKEASTTCKYELKEESLKLNQRKRGSGSTRCISIVTIIACKIPFLIVSRPWVMGTCCGSTNHLWENIHTDPSVDFEDFKPVGPAPD